MVGNKNKVLIKYYPEEHYYSVFNQNTGLFLRKEENGFSEPFWSKHGPELLDISITNFCSNNCNICYRESDVHGKHISIENIKIILEQAKKMDVRQIALGGGNPNEHPEFIKILEIIRDEFNIIPSYTTNGKYLTSDIIKASKQYCGAVAISTNKFDDELFNKLNILLNNNIKTNIHFIISAESIENIINYLKFNDSIPQKLNAIIFLNYKPVGRNKSMALLAKKSDLVQYFINFVTNTKFDFKIGFDSCFISALVKYSSVDFAFVDFCEAARFSAFIDENLKMFPCSFMINTEKFLSLKDYDMLSIWKESDLFNNFRNSLRNKSCECEKHSLCYGGCPIFPEINFC